MAQLFLNNFDSVFIAAVKAQPESNAPSSELDYGILRLSDGAAGRLVNPPDGSWYTLTAFKRSGTGEADYEVIRVLSVDNSVVGECRIRVERGQEGTSPTAYSNGDPVEMRLTAGTLQNLIQQSDPALIAPREPTGAAGGVLAGTYPNPSFKEAMATAAQLAGKVDKVPGMGLSANNLTNELLARIGSVEESATRNATDAQLRDRSTHTGVQAISTVTGLADALQASKQRSNHEGTQAIETVEGLQAALQALAPKVSPELQGAPTAPTAAQDNDSKQIANTAFVTRAVSAAVSKLMGGAASDALDTLIELGQALGNDADFAATMTGHLAGKVDKVQGMGLSANDFSDELRTKLGSIMASATKNATDAELRDRSTHTGTQAIETVQGLQDALQSKADRLQMLYSTGGDDGLPFAPDSINAIDASQAAARHLPDSPEAGITRVVLLNSRNTWASGLFSVLIPENAFLRHWKNGKEILINAGETLVLDTNDFQRIEFFCVSGNGEAENNFCWLMFCL